MANWQKEKNFKFKLKDLVVTEDYSIWRAWDKRTEVFKDKEGNEMQLPIKSGHLSTADGRLFSFDDLRVKSTKDFREIFPDFNPMRKYIRTVLIGGAEFNYAFGKTSNNKLLELIDMCGAMGKSPFDVVFEQSFTSTAAPAQMYSIKILADSTVAQPHTPVTPPPVIEPTGFKVEPNEKEVLDAIKSSVHGTGAKESVFIEIMKQNKIKPDRAKELYKEVYKK